MYVEHPYKFNDKFYAKVDGKFYEITREVAKAMLSAYRNEVYRSKKWQLIIPGLSEPPVRTLRATIPENERHIFR